jgi:hypothetical protein
MASLWAVAQPVALRSCERGRVRVVPGGRSVGRKTPRDRQRDLLSLPPQTGATRCAAPVASGRTSTDDLYSRATRAGGRVAQNTSDTEAFFKAYFGRTCGAQTLTTGLRLAREDSLATDFRPIQFSDWARSPQPRLSADRAPLQHGAGPCASPALRRRLLPGTARPN